MKEMKIKVILQKEYNRTSKLQNKFVINNIIYVYIAIVYREYMSAK